MDLPASLISTELSIFSTLLLAIILLWAAYTAPWDFVLTNPHVYFGAIVLTAFVWVMRAGIADGLNFHLLGMVMLTLMFGWRLALIAATAIVSISLLNQHLLAAIPVIPLNTLFMAGVPILLTHYMLIWTEKKLPANIFIYIFINAFLTGALSIAAVLGSGALLVLLSGAYDMQYLHGNYLLFIPLLMFPEAFINGMLIAVFVVYVPDWVRSFHDQYYLR